MAGSLSAPQQARLTVLYDEDCGLCRWTVDQLRGIDRRRRLEFVPLQHAAEHPERPDLARLAANSPLEESLHVLRTDGRVRRGGGAMLEILDALPGGWLLRPWAVLPGVEPVVDALYGHVARNRGTIGRLLARTRRGAAACDLHPPRVT
jgi:predicted DCC family thiol-disulfide oxidoreductase YuxK